MQRNKLMSRPARHDILFEQVTIGPKKAKNRFYQVPHCNGGGYRDPSAVAAMRGVKAEGGWGVVFTEQCEIHHTSEIAPFIELRLWDDRDIPMLAKMAAKARAHGALVGIELAYSGINGPNLYSREVPLAPTALPVRTFTNDPVSARAMDKKDIRNLRRWFVNACCRARVADYDLICLYGAHGFGVLQHFLSRVTNHRTDEYGGSLENRSRFVREIVSDVKDTVGADMGIILRLSLHEAFGDLGFSNAELRDFISMHAELPDLWDLAHGTWEDCSATSRFQEEGGQEELVRGIKALTPRPVVGVGRFTSPDAMVRQVQSGILDFIGCARPSIADPFLPTKIAEGRSDDIRECIGCNICVSGDITMSISRCTQNPSFMEEWRKGWHPEKMNARGKSQTVLIVGGGAAGLEAARALALRGYEVTLAEAENEFGGRTLKESKLPGLSTWRRVKDYREHQLRKSANALLCANSRLSAEQVLAFEFQHVGVATGSVWRRDGVSRHHVVPMPIDSDMPIYTPDDLMAGDIPSGNIVLFDDDHYYMGGVLAELLVQHGAQVTYITTAARVSDWTFNTLEHAAIHRKLSQLGVSIMLNCGVEEINRNGIITKCVYSDKEQPIEADAFVMVASRTGEATLWNELQAHKAKWKNFGIQSVTLFGDAEAPGPIAWATYAGHRYARELDSEDIGDALPFRREIVQLDNE